MLKKTLFAAAALLLMTACGSKSNERDAEITIPEATIPEATEAEAPEAEALETEEAEEPQAEELEDEEVAEEPTQAEEEGTAEADARFDEWLDDYEDYVDKYISFVKKAKSGDVRALAEYPALMQKAQDLNDKIEDVKSELSDSQLARYNKIAQKLAKAAAEI